MPRTHSLIPIRFPVLRGNEPATVTLDFAGHEDVIATTHWQVPRSLKRGAATRARAADAREFALFAAKRWRHYRDTGIAARNLPELRRMISSDPQGEYCFHLKLTAAWFPHSLGGAMVRRTWCHHLIVDFLFVHPRICGKIEPVKGAGVGILQGICLIARNLRCKCVWGEATRDSSSFYERQLGRAIEDSFTLDVSEIAFFADQIEKESRRA